jgi:hypothetical protein
MQLFKISYFIIIIENLSKYLKELPISTPVHYQLQALCADDHKNLQNQNRPTFRRSDPYFWHQL